MASLYQVKASAGSGKTYDLTRRFLCLLAACGSPAPAAAASCGLGNGPSGWDEILAITFTNAAAGEMRDRVIGRLKAIALGTPEKAIPLTPDMAAHWLDVILRDLASLNIRTIDSLLHAIVRSASLQLDLPPDFQPAFVSMDAVTPYLDTLLNQASQGNEAMEKLLRDLYWAIVHVQQSKGFNAGEKLGDIIRPLLDGILRGEWGCDGMVITDNVLNVYVNGPDGVLAGVSIYDAMMPYVTDKLPEYKNDGVIVSAMREACHHNLYAIANSCGMNGVGANTTIKLTRPTVITMVIIITCAAAFFCLLGIVLWIFGVRKLRKTEEYKAYKSFLKDQKAAKKA